MKKKFKSMRKSRKLQALAIGFAAKQEGQKAEQDEALGQFGDGVRHAIEPIAERSLEATFKEASATVH